MYLQFCGISGVGVLVCLKFLGVNLKIKNSRGFSKKYILNPPTLPPLFMFFSELAHFLVFQQKNTAISLSALILCSSKYGLSPGNLSSYWKLCHFHSFYLFIYFFWKQDFPIWNEKKIQLSNKVQYLILKMKICGVRLSTYFHQKINFS